MRPPGTRLRAWSARWCSARTRDRLVDPAIADLQIEYRDAIERGRRWRARWILAAGYVTFVEALAIHAAARAVRSRAEWNGDEGRAFVRTLAVAIASVVVATLLLLTPVRRSVPPAFMPYLVPQALPLTLPLAITLGILVGLRGRRALSVRLRAATLTLALVCSLISFATVAWIVPIAGQMYRVSMIERGGTFDTQRIGLIEMPLGELRQQMLKLTNEMRESGAGFYVTYPDRRAATARRYALAYHLRWALPCAPFVLALFALTIRPRTAVHWWLPTLAAFGLCIAYYLALVAGEAAGQRGLVPAAAARWLPNALFAAACLAVSTRRSRVLRFSGSQVEP